MDAAAMEEATETPQINLQPCPVEHLEPKSLMEVHLGYKVGPYLPVTSRVITPLTGVIIPVTVYPFIRPFTYIYIYTYIYIHTHTYGGYNPPYITSRGSPCTLSSVFFSQLSAGDLLKKWDGKLPSYLRL